MTTSYQVNQRVPAPVVGAMLILGLVVLFSGLAIVGSLLGDRPEPIAMAIYFCVLVGAAFAGVGAYFGWVLAMLAGAGVGGLLILAGLALATVPNLAIRLLGYDTLGLVAAGVGALLIGLLVAPQSSRTWFLYQHV